MKKDRLVYIGLRDVDSGEKKILREQGKPFLTSFYIDSQWFDRH